MIENGLLPDGEDTGVVVFRDHGSPTGECWRVFYKGGLIAAEWPQRGPAQAHLNLLESGYAKPQYAKGCGPT